MSTDDKPQAPEVDDLHDEEEDNWPQGLESLAVLQNEAYVVARGARPMCLVGEVPVESKGAAGGILRMVATQGQAGGLATLVPFMVLRRDTTGQIGDWYCCGFAKEPWVADTYAWLSKADIPTSHYQRLCGLLLGYGTEAIGHFSRKPLLIRE